MYAWKLEKIVQNTNYLDVTYEEIDLDSRLVDKNDFYLVLPGLTLEYGHYLITLVASMAVRPEIKDSDAVYLNVDPTPLVVNIAGKGHRHVSIEKTCFQVYGFPS